MLQHVVEIQILELVFGRMDLLVAVFERGFDDKCGRVPSLRRGRVVGAGVSTFRKNIWNLAVL